MAPVPEALQRAFLRPLRYRPLLWMAFAALAGVVVGGWWALSLAHGAPANLARDDWRLAVFWLPALLALAATWATRRQGWMWRLAWSAALFCFFASDTALRVVPPADDVSSLTRLATRPNGPLAPKEVVLRGLVAASPRRGEFNTQFPLQCLSPAPGLVWVSVSPQTTVEVGDEVEFHARLLPLAAPTNPGQKIEFWSQLGNNCWCEARRVEKFRRQSVGAAFPLERWTAGVRGALLARVETTMRGDGSPVALGKRPFPGAMAQLLTAMVFGEGGLARPLPRQVRDDFRAAGLGHILVSSGTQCVVLAGVILLLGRKFRFPAWLIFLGCVPLLGVYALVAGSSASISRATLAALLVALALVVGREQDGLSIWSAALLVSLFFDPLVAWSLSWQLTFAATWGLIALAPLFWNPDDDDESHLLGRFLNGSLLLDGAALTLGAQFAVAPISLLHFGTWSVAGLSANLLALPLAEFMVLTGAAGLLLPPLNILNYWLSRGMLALAHSAASLPGASLERAPLSLRGAWLFYLSLGIILAVRVPDLRAWGRDGLVALKSILQQQIQVARSSFNPWLALGGLLIVLVGLAWWRLHPAPAQLRLVMLDVGQGESLVVISPGGRAVLVDGGSLDARTDVGEGVILPALAALGIDHLDAVFLTHADADHCNALRSVLREVPVAAFVDGAEAAHQLQARQTVQNFDPAATDYRAVRAEVTRQGIPLVTPVAEQTWAFDGAQITALAPTAPAFDKDNENCLVLRVEWGQSAMLLTGDLEGNGEARLVQRGVALQANVLKVAHHGSGGSSTAPFLHAVAPQIALISCGKYNTFGHPAPVALQRLHESGAQEFRTDLDGAIEVDCDQTQCRALPARD